MSPVATNKPGKPSPGTDISIVAERNTFADEFLDVIGADFRFDHAKGLAEWMKNSADAYSTTTDTNDSEQYIVLRFRVGRPKRNSVFECIDFVGMTKENIDEALKVWGLTTAAKRGKDVATFGGHGNGGKFYMRQMFDRAHFITFRSGKLNIFGFDEEKRYGYAAGFQEVEMELADAIEHARLDGLKIPQEVWDRWNAEPENAGFTVVRGEGPDRFRGRSTVQSILERLRVHPQSRRILRHNPVIYLRDKDEWGERLELPQIEPRAGFEEPRVIPLPATLDIDGEELDLAAVSGGKGALTLYTSAVPLTRTSDLAAMNTIDVLGAVGCIGSYRMHELGFMRFAPETEFMYGEVEAVFLENEEYGSVSNDREKLVENELTVAVLEWVRQQVDAFASEIAEKRSSQKKKQDLKMSALFNQLLDRWKNRFMAKLTGELFGGSGIGDSWGGTGGGGGGGDDAGKGDAEGSGEGSNAGDEGGKDDGGGAGENEGGGGEGIERKAGPRFPMVLLSGYDQDPLSETGEVWQCDERHPPIYQRPEDVQAGLYWINTSRAFASKLLTVHGAEHVRWREYLFQRYVEIILKQSVYELAKQDPEMTADKIDGLIDNVTSRVHDAAAEDLETFLFDETLVGGVADQEPVSAPVATDA